MHTTFTHTQGNYRTTIKYYLTALVDTDMSMQSHQPKQKKPQYKDNIPSAWEMQKNNDTLSTIYEVT
jgi:hypothetical protein